MFNPFSGRMTETRMAPVDESTTERAEKEASPKVIGEKIRRLLALATIAFTELFATQAAGAQDTSPTERDSAAATHAASVGQERHASSESLRGVFESTNQLQEMMEADPEIVTAFGTIIESVAASVPLQEEPTFFDTNATGTLASGFVNLHELDLTLKGYAGIDTSRLGDSITKIGDRFATDQYASKVQAIEEQLVVAKGVIDSRPNFKKEHFLSRTVTVGNANENGMPLGVGEVTKVTSGVRTIPLHDAPTVGRFGNMELYVLFKSIQPLIQEVGRTYATIMGCPTDTVETNVSLLSSVHFERSGAVSTIPYNNVHPTLTIKACPRNYKLLGTTNVTVSETFTMYSNSNGLGAENLNDVYTREDWSFRSSGSAKKNMQGWNSHNAIAPTNRMIVMAGLEIAMPIASIPGNPKPLEMIVTAGIQDGYTVNGNKVSPAGSIAIRLGAQTVGFIPGGMRGERRQNVLYFSTMW